jgi:hypothetical protein
MKAQLIDPVELEQREVMRRNAIANAAMELARGIVSTEAGATANAGVVADHALAIATEIFNYVNPPVASRLQ